MSMEYIPLIDKGMHWYKEYQNRHVSKMQLQNIFYTFLPVLFLMLLHNTICPSVPFKIKEEEGKKHKRKTSSTFRKMDHFFNNPVYHAAHQ